MASPSSSSAARAGDPGAGSDSRRGDSGPGSTSDAFALLGLPARFDLEPAVIERAFFEKTKELHPDRFAIAPVAERVVALSRARALNDAYQLVKREVSRAEYLLAREGITIGDNERIDPALVMELLEEREVLAEVRQRGDLAQIEVLCSGMRTRRRAALAEVKARFADVIASSGSPDRTAEPAAEGSAADPVARGGRDRAGSLMQIKRQLILLRYVERYLEECNAALDED